MDVTLCVNIQENRIVYADRYMVMLVMRNLVSNAIKFTNTGGEMTLTSGDMP